MSNIKVEIGDFLVFCDLSGEDALTSTHLENLERYIMECQDAQNRGDSIVPDAVYDRLMEILRRNNPNSPLCTQIWEDGGSSVLDDYDAVFNRNPMYSIQTIKNIDSKEMHDFVERLPDVFDAHISMKENGFGIRIVYSNGELIKARTRARSSQGRDITNQLRSILGDLSSLPQLEGVGLCEIRGEVLCSFENYSRAKSLGMDVKSPFTAVSSLIKESATENEWGMLNFVAYDIISDDIQFSTKTEIYEFLSDELGFEIPIFWTVDNLSKEEIYNEIETILSDCESAVDDYEYYTDGIVFEVDSRSLFHSLGDNGSNYRYGNVALKVGFWEQNVYSGFVQTIVWKRGKVKLSPVAIVAEEPDMIEFTDFGEHNYVGDFREIANIDSLGVLTAGGNKVRRIPLYEPSNILVLDAYVGSLIHFRYGGESGVTPCYPDGTPLVEGKVKGMFEDEYEDEDDIMDLSI